MLLRWIRRAVQSRKRVDLEGASPRDRNGHGGKLSPATMHSGASLAAETGGCAGEESRLRAGCSQDWRPMACGPMRKGLRFVGQCAMGCAMREAALWGRQWGRSTQAMGPRHYLLARRRLRRPTMPNPRASEIQPVGSGVADDPAYTSPISKASCWAALS
jgi:hypothetical protein